MQLPSENSNTFILNRNITPKVSWQALWDGMTELFDIEKSNPTLSNPTQSNSLTEAWGQEKQSDWDLYKKISIRLIDDYLKKQPMNALELYALIADCRKMIAIKLNQENKEKIGKARSLSERNIITPMYNNHGPYMSFMPILKEKFTKDFPDSNNHYIEVDQKKLSSIDLVEYFDMYIFGLTHCPADEASFALLSNKIDVLFEYFLKSNSTKDTLSILSQLVYYFTIAMPLERGSAATAEMFSQVLLKSKGLNLYYKNEDGISMDLQAYFSKDMDAFIKHFSSNHVAASVTKPSIGEFFSHASKAANPESTPVCNPGGDANSPK